MLFGVPETSFALPHSLTYSLARTGGPLSGANEGPTLWREQEAHSPARTGGPARFYYWPNYVGGPINDVEMNCACCSCSGLSLSGVTFNYYSRHMAKRFDLIFKLLEVSFCMLDPGCSMLDA